MIVIMLEEESKNNSHFFPESISKCRSKHPNADELENLKHIEYLWIWRKAEYYQM